MYLAKEVLQHEVNCRREYRRPKQLSRIISAICIVGVKVLSVMDSLHSLSTIGIHRDNFLHTGQIRGFRVDRGVVGASGMSNRITTDVCTLFTCDYGTQRKCCLGTTQKDFLTLF